MPDLAGARILDVACGQGLATRALAHRGPLSGYLDAVLTRGFHLEAVDEPRATERLLAQQPVYRDLPIVFTARVRAA